MRQLIVLCIVAAIGVSEARAQSFEASGHFAASQWSEYDTTDYGFGGRFTFKPIPLIGIDAELTWYPSDFAEQISFSKSRFEGLFGATVGPKLGSVRPFVKAAVGFLDVGSTPGAFACIAIFPPPLSCVLAGGQTLPAYDVGGGIEIDTSGRSFVRADVSGRILKYPGPTLRDNFERSDDGFFGTAWRFTVGGGLRF